MAEALIRRLTSWGHSVSVFMFEEGPERAALERLGAVAIPSTDRFHPCDAFVFSGGSLGPGFGWQLAVPALMSGAKLIAFGVEYDEEWLGRAIRGPALNMLLRHDLIAVRDKASGNLLSHLRVPYLLGADPALDMRCEPSARSGCAVFIRAPGRSYSPPKVSASSVLLFSSRKDVEYGKSLGIPYELHESPDALLRRIASCESVYTYGRYHPAVFAAVAGVPFAGEGRRLERSDFLTETVDAMRERLDGAWETLGALLG